MGEQMLRLSGNIDSLKKQRTNEPSGLYTLTMDPCLPGAIRNRFALLADRQIDVAGYGAQLLGHDAPEQNAASLPSNAIYRLPSDFQYLKSGDIVFIEHSKPFLHTLFRKGSNHNTVLLTEQCNHYCLMCSQPPKTADDSYLLERAFALIQLIPNDTHRICFSGGEPTLYGQGLIDLVRHAKLQLPNTVIDILSNGRRFKDKEFARRFAEVEHPNCMLGIPIYSDDPVRHDYVVQSPGAFDETVQGILNLKRFGQKVEIRIVLHKQTIDRLPQTCEFICRNLLFVDHVALMGLEITGFTRPNLDTLWVDPYDYKHALSKAVNVLTSYGMNTSVYNHQLCVVNRDVDGVYRKSISDWKNEYLEVCSTCTRKPECGGFFSSSKMYKHSQHISPFS
jgi:His-Xaa-Ser system radical SAM maturase HxsC